MGSMPTCGNPRVCDRKGIQRNTNKLRSLSLVKKVREARVSIKVIERNCCANLECRFFTKKCLLRLSLPERHQNNRLLVPDFCYRKNRFSQWVSVQILFCRDGLDQSGSHCVRHIN
jgi:hypothetical protein